jgi:hypothetical protein
MLPLCRTYRSPSTGPCLLPYTHFGSTITKFKIENKDWNTKNDILLIKKYNELYAFAYSHTKLMNTDISLA